MRNHTNLTRNLTKLVLAGLVTLFTAAGLADTAAAASKAPSGVVNLNTATEAQLTLLPGIGPSKARAILEFRAQRPFKSPSELTQVKGIGQKLFHKVEPYLAVEGQTTIKAPAKKKKRRAKAEAK